MATSTRALYVMSRMSDVLEGWSRTTFTYDGATKDVFRRGEGPAVLVMHEIPGITPQVARFADRVVDAGFTVFLPHMFGEVGRPLSVPYALGQMARACVSREVHVLASQGSSPITEWLRALARHAFAEIGGRGVGAIGMCLTGNFALALSVDEAMRAPVLSQPSLPFAIGSLRGGIHVSEDALTTIKRRTRDDGLRVLGLRFTCDPTCPTERFDTLRRELGDAFEAIEIDSSPGNPHEIPRRAHSVVTTDLVDREGHPTRAALDRVLGFFREHLCEDGGVSRGAGGAA
jgi:dienelactone hydrolase